MLLSTRTVGVGRGKKPIRAGRDKTIIKSATGVSVAFGELVITAWHQLARTIREFELDPVSQGRTLF